MEFWEALRDNNKEVIEKIKRGEIITQNIQWYLEALDLKWEDLIRKRVLDMGCGDGEFIQYLLKNNIADDAYGLDNQINFALEKNSDISIALDKDKYLIQDYLDDIKIKDFDFILFKSAFYPTIIPKSLDIFKKLVENNLAENGEIRVQVSLDENLELLTPEWRKIFSSINESGLNYELDEEKELLIIRK